MEKGSCDMNKKKKERITFAGIINSLIFGLFTFICVYPLWYIFINSGLHLRL